MRIPLIPDVQTVNNLWCCLLARLAAIQQGERRRVVTAECFEVVCEYGGQHENACLEITLAQPTGCRNTLGVFTKLLPSLLWR